MSARRLLPSGRNRVLAPSKTVRIANQFVRNNIKVSNALAGRILSSFISLIKSDDSEFFEYSIPASSILNHSSGYDYNEIKKACEQLVKSSVQGIKNDQLNEKHPDYMYYALFSSIGYENGFIKAQLNPQLKTFLLDLKSRFTKYTLSDFMGLPSQYSQRMFEILTSYKNLPSIEIDLQELHLMLDTPDSFRSVFRNFRDLVLKKSYEDIHAKTSLRYEWEPVYLGRSIVAIKFIFKSKKKISQETKSEPQTFSDLTQATSHTLKQLRESFTAPLLDHSESQSCWISRYQEKNPCPFRLSGVVPDSQKCQICLEKIPVSSFGV